MLAYLVGHGLVKGALFMVAGHPAGDAAAASTRSGCAASGAASGRRASRWRLGGLLLAGLPLGLMDDGHRADRRRGARCGGHGWVDAARGRRRGAAPAARCCASPGAIFLGLGPGARRGGALAHRGGAGEGRPAALADAAADHPAAAPRTASRPCRSAITPRAPQQASCTRLARPYWAWQQRKRRQLQSS